MLNPDMPESELKLHMGEMTEKEVRMARAAIRWANSQSQKFTLGAAGELMDLPDKYRLLALKKAAIVMNALADTMENHGNKQETQMLTWSIIWAANKIESESILKASKKQEDICSHSQ